MTVTTDNMLIGAPVYVVRAHCPNLDVSVFMEAFSERNNALEVLVYGRRMLPDYEWDMDFVTRPSVEYAIHKIDTHVESLDAI